MPTTTKPKPRSTLESESEPSVAEQDHAKLAAIRKQNEVVYAKEKAWSGLKEQCADAKREFDDAVGLLRGLIDDSRQGELFAGVAKEVGDE